MTIKNRMPICNNNPSSAPSINGKCFFLCWRCTGGILGAMLIISIIFLANINTTIRSSLISIVLIIPATVDYVLIRIKAIKPCNIRRFVTGFLLGGAVGHITLWTFEFVVKLFK